MEGSIRIFQQQEHTLIKLEGVLDQELAANLTGMIHKTEAPVVLDLQQVPHVTVAGSRAILHFYQLQKVKPSLRNVNADIISTLELTGTNSYINLVTQ